MCLGKRLLIVNETRCASSAAPQNFELNLHVWWVQDRYPKPLNTQTPELVNLNPSTES